MGALGALEKHTGAVGVNSGSTHPIRKARGPANNFASRRFLRHDGAMRLAAWVVVALALTACGRGPPRARYPPQLVARAWQGREPPATGPGRAVAQFASAQVGRRYCWGGTGPECFDCSGLVQQAWASVGVRLPRTTGALASELSEVPLDDVRAGDILWWPGHVGVYEGNGWMVDALDTRHGVVRRPAADPPRALRP
jgi:NlpC/P60 family